MDTACSSALVAMHTGLKFVKSEGGNNGYVGPIMDMTTGYFGLYRPYRDLVLQSAVSCRIVCSAPKVSS